MFSSPKDGLLHMYNSHMLEKDSCYDPETEEAVIILDALVSEQLYQSVEEVNKRPTPPSENSLLHCLRSCQAFNMR